MKSKSLFILVLFALAAFWSGVSSGQSLITGSGEEFSAGWPEIVFPSPNLNLETAPPNVLVAISASVDLSQATDGMSATVTLALCCEPPGSRRRLTFYLNPGLQIHTISSRERPSIPFSREDEAVSVDLPEASSAEAYQYLVVQYQGHFQSHPVFKPQENSESILTEDFLMLPPEALWYPWMPGQSFTGRLRVWTAPGISAYTCVPESKIIEREGRRTTDFVWNYPIQRLALAGSRSVGAQFARDQFVLEMVVPKELAPERGRLHTILLNKVSFYEQAFYPLPWQRLNVISRPDNGPAVDGHGWIVLPESAVAVHLLGDPLLDRLLARQWFTELIQFVPRQEEMGQGWTEFAARLYLQEIFESRAQTLWKAEGRWITRLARPQIPWRIKLPWILRDIEHRLGRNTFWELNQEFLQRFLYQQVEISDYLDLAEEIIIGDFSGKQLREYVEPWLENNDIPILSYSVEIVDGTPSQVVITVTQQTSTLWNLDLQLSLHPTSEGPTWPSRRENLSVEDSNERYVFSVPASNVRAELDPDWRVLCKRIELKTARSGKPPDGMD